MVINTKNRIENNKRNEYKLGAIYFFLSPHSPHKIIFTVGKYTGNHDIVLFCISAFVSLFLFHSRRIKTFVSGVLNSESKVLSISTSQLQHLPDRADFETISLVQIRALFQNNKIEFAPSERHIEQRYAMYCMPFSMRTTKLCQSFQWNYLQVFLTESVMISNLNVMMTCIIGPPIR